MFADCRGQRDVCRIVGGQRELGPKGLLRRTAGGTGMLAEDLRGLKWPFGRRGGSEGSQSQ